MTEPRRLYCWFDTEYTTLELERARLLEVALIVTDDASPNSAQGCLYPLIASEAIGSCCGRSGARRISAQA